MRRALTGFILAAVILAVTGCAGAGGGHGRTAVPPGSTVVLTRALDVPAGVKRAYIQGGRVVAYGDVSRFEPSCSFGQRVVDRTALLQTIEPDSFTAGVSRAWTQAAGAGDDGTRVASAGLLMLLEDRERLGMITYRTEIPLQSPRQPEIDDLTCAYDRESIPPNQYLTLEQIRAALGDIVEIRLPSEG